eukprot:CAMPEP_0196818024 /NCGR_PEP_ID=MMETSP1362-20130617/63675_1 /TAXON_ID=163516 /ORGANISM="Leptocylindrus danicus, Strain CCMP1856" /LENGTH=524 /DNA_ID=CAMNT_0042195933 /DNA_START=105 /DNA_END=1679 /DNA_ORIENTATION=-
MSTSSLGDDVMREDWFGESLAIVVIGASGDLAKKKTYPSLFNLFLDDLLPQNTVIYGYARSAISHEDFRKKIHPYLIKGADEVTMSLADVFLEKCFYENGTGYGDFEAYDVMKSSIDSHFTGPYNKLFYFAIPPNVFAASTSAVHKVYYDPADETSFLRIIVEKPFGRDLESCKTLGKTLAQYFSEKHLFRIDHYLGKEMVQNLLVMRFGNIWFEDLFNRDRVANIILTFKEPFGTDGRGGYFDKFGIIRDIIQNHLVQVLCLLVMEPPTKVEGEGAGDHIRDAKVAALKSILPPTLDDCVLGQYDGYLDDPTISNKESNTPTFAAVMLKINNPRWAGVPIILKAGKALNERKAEMRIQFKDAPAGTFLFDTDTPPPRNELVIRLQPKEAIYMKTNVKAPGFATHPIQTELEVNYDSRFKNFSSREANPDAYTRLILDVLRNKQAAFVRDDELIASWKIFTPLLHKIEEGDSKPIIYQPGGRGPKEADEFIKEKCDFKRNEDYVYHGPTKGIAKRNSHKDLSKL